MGDILHLLNVGTKKKKPTHTFTGIPPAFTKIGKVIFITRGKNSTH